jgi:hypothetical protein
MNPTIAVLDDRTAIQVLDSIVRNSAESASPDVDLFGALKQEYGGGVPVAVSEGDLARAALELLIADPELGPHTIALAAQPPAERFDLGLLSGAAVVTLALSVLQTQADISWDKNKGLRIALKKRAASDSLLRQFLAKLGNFKL